MKKLVKVVVCIVAGLFLVLGGIGMFADARFEARSEHVIDAPLEKVWEVVSTPERTPDWMPVEEAQKAIVAVKRPSPVETLARAAEMATKSGGVDPSKLARHTYVSADKEEMTVEVYESRSQAHRMERVVLEGSAMGKMFRELAWGFEMSDAGGGKTRLRPIMKGEGARPIGVLLSKMGSWTGAYDKFQARIARNIEAVAKGGKRID